MRAARTLPLEPAAGRRQIQPPQPLAPLLRGASGRSEGSSASAVSVRGDAGERDTDARRVSVVSGERRGEEDLRQHSGEELVHGDAHTRARALEEENAKLLRRIRSLEVAVDAARGDAADAAQERDREHARSSTVLRSKTEAEAALDGMHRELARERAQAERAASELTELRADVQFEKTRWQQTQHQLSEANALIADLQREGEVMNKTINRMQQLLDAERTRGTNAAREQAGAALLAERERSRELETELQSLRQSRSERKPKPPPPSSPPPMQQADKRRAASRDRWIQQHQHMAVERGADAHEEHVLRHVLGTWRSMLVGRLHDRRHELETEMQQLVHTHAQQTQIAERSQQAQMQQQSELVAEVQHLESEVQRLQAEVQRLLHTNAQQVQMIERTQQALMLAENAARTAAAEAAAASASAVNARGPQSTASHTWAGGQRVASETASWHSSVEGTSSRQDWQGLRGMIDNALSSGNAILARQVWARAEGNEFTDAEIQECEGMLTELAEFILQVDRANSQQTLQQSHENQQTGDVLDGQMMMDDQHADDLGPISEGALSTEGSMSGSEEDSEASDPVLQSVQNDEQMIVGLRHRIDQALGVERNPSVVNGLLEEAAAAKRQGHLPADCDSAVHGLRMYLLTLENEAEFTRDHYEHHSHEDLRERIDNVLGVERNPLVVRRLLEEAAAAKRSGELPPECDAAVQGLRIYATTLDDAKSLDREQGEDTSSNDSTRYSDVDGVTEAYAKLSREGEAALASGQLAQVHALVRAADMLENVRPLPDECTDIVRRLRQYAALFPSPRISPREEVADTSGSSGGGDKVVAWFAEHGLGQYGEEAVAQGFDAMWVLRSLEVEGIRELHESVGMKPGHAQKFKFALRRLAEDQKAQDVKRLDGSEQDGVDSDGAESTSSLQSTAGKVSEADPTSLSRSTKVLEVLSPDANSERDKASSSKRGTEANEEGFLDSTPDRAIHDLFADVARYRLAKPSAVATMRNNVRSGRFSADYYKRMWSGRVAAARRRVEEDLFSDGDSTDSVAAVARSRVQQLMHREFEAGSFDHSNTGPEESEQQNSNRIIHEHTEFVARAQGTQDEDAVTVTTLAKPTATAAATAAVRAGRAEEGVVVQEMRDDEPTATVATESMVVAAAATEELAFDARINGTPESGAAESKAAGFDPQPEPKLAGFHEPEPEPEPEPEQTELQPEPVEPYTLEPESEDPDGTRAMVSEQPQHPKLTFEPKANEAQSVVAAEAAKQQAAVAAARRKRAEKRTEKHSHPMQSPELPQIGSESSLPATSANETIAAVHTRKGCSEVTKSERCREHIATESMQMHRPTEPIAPPSIGSIMSAVDSSKLLHTSSDSSQADEAATPAPPSIGSIISAVDTSKLLCTSSDSSQEGETPIDAVRRPGSMKAKVAESDPPAPPAIGSIISGVDTSTLLSSDESEVEVSLRPNSTTSDCVQLSEQPAIPPEVPHNLEDEYKDQSSQEVHVETAKAQPHPGDAEGATPTHTVDLAQVASDPRLREMKTVRTGEELHVTVRAEKLGRDLRLRDRVIVVSNKAVSDADSLLLKPYHRVALRNLQGIAVPASHQTALVVKVDATRSRIADMYLACGTTAERNVLVKAIRSAFEATTRRTLPVLAWAADHPRAMAVCGIVGVTPEGDPEHSRAYVAVGSGRRDSMSSVSSFGSELSVAGVDGPQPPQPEPIEAAARRAGIFAAVDAEELMEMQHVEDRQAQYAELREAEKELLKACRLARDASGGHNMSSRVTELEITLAEVGRELRKLEDLGVRPL